MDVNIEDIKNIAKKAGDKILEYYNSSYNIRYKGKKSPVTDADLESEKIIKRELEKYSWPILSEESADDKSRLNSEYVWIVDPLDGTSDFIDKTDEFSVVIGLVNNKKPIAGVIYEPALKRLSYAEKGKGSYIEADSERKKLAVSREDNFQKMSILISRHHLMEMEKKSIKKLKIGNSVTRGSVAKMTIIAEGKAHIYINSSDKSSEWDTCGGEIIIKEAGGKITDKFGKEILYNNDNPRLLNGYVVSNGKKHNEIVEALKDLK